jgi:hypothetical protein
MTGILSRLKGYIVRSNRESGHGRTDLVMYPPSVAMGKAVIFEIKPAKKFGDLPAACRKALQQIEDKNYVAYWNDEGYTDMIKYGIGFYKKNCMVMKN